MIAGNKVDLADVSRMVKRADGEQLAAKIEAPFFEVSAKEDLNVLDAFKALAQSALDHVVTLPSEHQPLPLDLKVGPKKKGCC